MCGIAGVTGLCRAEDLDRFRFSLRHRGPDDYGQLCADQIGLSHTRLAIIDLHTGNQPIFNEDRSCAIIFNGEIYNYRELREQLRARHRFTTETDTEAILHLYEERGFETPSYLKGDFAFCIWDSRDQSCFLSRDPLGVKPLFYSVTRNGRLVFASELRSVLQHPDVAADVDTESFAEYMACLYVSAPRTIFKNIRKLQPGESAVWKAGSLRTWKYWKIPEPQAIDLPAAEVRERALSGIKTAVKRRLIADVPVGAFLSGGLDSSLIVALASEYSPGLHTFSIGYGDADFNELPYARAVSQRYGTTHHEFTIDARAENLIESVIDAFDEPIADSSAIPSYLIAQKTRPYVKVALSGIGGDELFFGYPRYLGAKLGEQIPQALGAPVALLSRLWTSRPSGRDVGGWIRRFGEGLQLGPEARYVQWTTFLSHSARSRLYTEPDGASVEAGMMEAIKDAGGALLDRLFRFDLDRYVASDLLPLCDNMTMAHSLEVRVPFCDVDLVEMMARIPARSRFPGYRLKPILRDISRSYLPSEIIHRKKQGFMIPIGRWFRQELRDYVEACLEPARLPGLIDARAVRELWNQHLTNRVNGTHTLWAIVLFSAWMAKSVKRQSLN